MTDKQEDRKPFGTPVASSQDHAVHAVRPGMPGHDWVLGEDTLRSIAEIDENIRMARHAAGGFRVD